MGMDPERAARIIADAVVRNKAAVRVGWDSLLVDWARRFAPGLLRRGMLRAAGELRSD